MRDHGPGFPAGKRDELFNMFVRGETGTGESGSSKPGTGLGLAICRAIVEAHGGQIRADDAAGGGARVTFSLPLGTPPIIEEEQL